jgi:serine protease Do
MKKWIKYISPAVLATSIIGSISFAQDTKDKAPRNKEGKTEEIVIRKKRGNTEKMTIVVDGDKVTINGKPAEDFKNDNVTVFKRDRSQPALAMGWPGVKSFNFPPQAFGPEQFGRDFSLSNKAMLGVMTEKGDNGVKVREVTKESAAEKAGLQKDDVITKVGDKTVNDPHDLVEAISGYKPNDKVDITYKRNGKESKTTATLGENKQAFSYNFNDDHFNLVAPPGDVPSGDNFNFFFNRRPKIGLQIQDVEDGKGVTVKDVDDDSPASKAGLKEGDVITEVNGKAVANVDELRDEIKDAKEGDAVKFTLKRDGKNQTIEVKLPKRLKSADL